MEDKEAIVAEIHRFMARLEWYKEQLIWEPPLFVPPPGGRPRYRRMAARLRAGKVESPNPELTAEEFADYLDLCVEQAELKQQFSKEVFAFAEWLQKTVDSALHEVYEGCVGTYKAAKKLAEEQGPDSSAAEFCRIVQPIFRKMQGPHKGRSRSRGRASRGDRAAPHM